MRKTIDGKVISMAIMGVIFAYVGFSINVIVGIAVVGFATLGITHVIRINQGKEPLIGEAKRHSENNDDFLKDDIITDPTYSSLSCNIFHHDNNNW